jgi:hypothetical protein
VKLIIKLKIHQILGIVFLSYVLSLASVDPHNGYAFIMLTVLKMGLARPVGRKHSADRFQVTSSKEWTSPWIVDVAARGYGSRFFRNLLHTTETLCQ